MTLYIEGFSRFVTSTTAPITTGWSESCRVGLSPLRDRAFFTAHRNFGLVRRQWPLGQNVCYPIRDDPSYQLGAFIVDVNEIINVTLRLGNQKVQVYDRNLFGLSGIPAVVAVRVPNLV